jgi:polysaccharide biosynthesis protein PslG
MSLWRRARARVSRAARALGARGALAGALFIVVVVAVVLLAPKSGQRPGQLGEAPGPNPTLDRLHRAPQRSDVDRDRVPNRRDPDIDGDGVRNRYDRDTDGDGRRNQLDHDIDADGKNNAFDADSDGSGDSYLAPRPARRLPPGFLGVVSDDAFWGTDADPDGSNSLAVAVAAGARVLRQSFSWSIIEREAARYDFSLHDHFVANAARAGLGVLPILIDPPPFRSSRPATGARRGVYPPASNAEFAAFAQLLVRRYGPDGGFWRANPQLPQTPIRSWEVWNEPNLPQFWATGPDPAAYAVMLKPVYTAIKAVDPGARVVSAGINSSSQGIGLVPFLRGMYSAGAKGSFDALGLHPYQPGSDLVVDEIGLAVRELRRAGDDARVLITELGWASGGPARRAMVVGERGQAALVRRTLPLLWRLRHRLRLDGLVYYDGRDAPASGGERDQWGLHTGLLRADGSAKPALRAITELAG